MKVKKLNSSKIIRDIYKNGFSVVKGLVSSSETKNFIKLLESSRNANANNIIGGSSSTGSYFLSNGIACSDNLLKLIASDTIIDLSSKYLDSQPYLKCHRVYKTVGKISNFPWHTDNKDKNSKFDNSKGIICILYLNDIKKGGLEVIPKGYHKAEFSKPSNKVIRSLIRENGTFRFEGNAGDAIFFDQALIHRAAQDFFAGKAYSLWFQITDKNAVREQLLLKNHQIPSEKDVKYKFLNIGIKSDDYAQPKTRESQIPTSYAFKLFWLSIPNSLENRIRSLLRPLKLILK